MLRGDVHEKSAEVNAYYRNYHAAGDSSGAFDLPKHNRRDFAIAT